MSALPVITWILLPILAYWLARRPPSLGNDVIADQIIPRGIKVESRALHWGLPPIVTRVNAALLTEVICHPAFVDRPVPNAWFKWSPSDARRRARIRATQDERTNVLPIRTETRATA